MKCGKSERVYGTLQILAKGTSTYDNSGSGDRDVYSTHIQKRYKVTFLDEDGETVLAEDVYPEGTTPDYRGKTPEKVAQGAYVYTFAGWEPELTPVSADAVYTAQYDRKYVMRHTLSLDGDIAVNFYYYIAPEERDDATVVFRYRGKETTAEGPTKSSDSYLRYTFRVPAKEMTENIHASLYLDDVLVNEHDYSVRTYAEHMANSGSSKLAVLLKSMLNYGGYAQTFFRYRTEDMANSGIDSALPEIDKNEIDCPAFDGNALSDAVTDYGLTYLGSTLVLESNTEMRFYFSAAEGANLPEVKVNGKATSWKENGTGKYIEIGNIYAQNVGNSYQISIAECSFECRPLNYVKNKLNESDEDLSNLVKALYVYYRSAKDYFQNN